jgi:predicted transcriptional regulator
MIRVRMDRETVAKLDESAEALNTTRSDVIRKGIEKVHDEVKK